MDEIILIALKYFGILTDFNFLFWNIVSLGCKRILHKKTFC